MRKAVAYYRVSTRRQGRSGLGLEAQRRIVRQYCKLNNIQLIKEFVEIKSGRNNKRVKVHAAIDFCRKNDALLLVATQSRLARSVAFIATLIEGGFVFISVENPTANDFQKHVQAAFDEYYSKENSRNTKLSLESARKNGVKLGGNSEKMKKTIRRKRKAYLKNIRPVIRQVQKRFQTVRDITSELNRLGVKNFRGKKGGWHISTVHKILNELNQSA